MSIDWEALYSRWNAISEMGEHSAAAAWQEAVTATLEALKSMYGRCDLLAARAWDYFNAISRGISNIEVTIDSVDTQLSSMLRSAVLPGGRLLYPMHDLCSLNSVYYDPSVGGYGLNLAQRVRILSKHSLSRPQFSVLYAPGESYTEGDASTLYDGSEDTSLRLVVRRDSLVMHSPSDPYTPPAYKHGAIVYCGFHMFCPAQFNKLVLKTAEPVHLLGYGLTSHNWHNNHNLWSDWNLSGAWTKRTGGNVRREWSNTYNRNVVVMETDGADSVIISPQLPVQLQSGRSAHEAQFHRAIYGLELSYVMMGAPAELTVTVYDSSKVIIQDTRRLETTNGMSLIQIFHGIAPWVSGQLRIHLALKRLSSKRARLMIGQIRFCDWIWFYYFDGGFSNYFDVPMSRRTATPRDVFVVFSTPHLRTDNGVEYYSNLKQLELLYEMPVPSGSMLAPAIQQSVKPITQMKVFLEGSNLENCVLQVSPDSSFSKYVEIPAQQAAAPGGVQVNFAPYIGRMASPSQLPAYSIQVPMQYATESFTGGAEFSLKHAPYCHPVFLRNSMSRLGRYEPNLDLSQMDPADIQGIGGPLLEGITKSYNTVFREWSASVVEQAAPVYEESEYFVLDSYIPALTDTQPNQTERDTMYEVFTSQVTLSVPGQPWFTTGYTTQQIPNRVFRVYPHGGDVINDFNHPQAAQHAYMVWDHNLPGEVHPEEYAVVAPGGSAEIGRTSVFARAPKAVLTNTTDRWVVMVRYAHADNGVDLALRSVAFPGNNQGHYLTAFRAGPGRYTISVDVSRPRLNDRKPRPAAQARLRVLVDVFLPENTRTYTTNYVQLDETPKTLSYELDLDRTVLVSFVVDATGDFCVSFPRITANTRPVGASQTVGNALSMSWSIPSIQAGADVLLDIPITFGNGRDGARISLEKIVASGFQQGGGGLPVVEAFLFGLTQNPIPLADPQGTVSASGSTVTVTSPSWRVTSTNAFRYLRLRFRAAATGAAQVAVHFKLQDGKPVLVLRETVTVHQPISPPQNPRTTMRWQHAGDGIPVSPNTVIALRIRVRGFPQGSVRVLVNGNYVGENELRISDDEFVSVDMVRDVSVSIVQTEQVQMRSLAVEFPSPLSEEPKPIYVAVHRTLRVVSLFDTLAPVKVTIITPYGTFLPDPIGPLPLGGTRYVSAERLEPASDQLVQEYRQQSAQGSRSRALQKARTVYATMFSPLVQSQDYPMVVRLYSRTNNQLVKTLARNEYLVDYERGLIEPLFDVKDDQYLVASYRFRVVSEEQLRLYSQRVRQSFLTRNRTDYLGGSVPELKPFQFGVEAANTYTVMEYYHEGNRLVLADEVPEPEGGYLVRVSYWYLPVNPAVRLVMRPGSGYSNPIVRKLVVQV